MSTYQAKTQNIIQEVLKNHFDEFEEKYEELYGCEYGSVQIIRIKELVQNFLFCGDYREGMARIQCSNPECRHEYFRPFSCKGFYLCPSCHQKRLLIFSEKLSDEVLLRLPHRQFVFTFPKSLRRFFRKDRQLYSEISCLIHNLVHQFYNDLSKNEIKTGSVISYQSFGDFMRFNPHFHCIIMEGGIDDKDRFHHISLDHTGDLLQLFRLKVLQHFVNKKIITRHIAKKLYSWKHSGFSIDHSVKIPSHSKKLQRNIGQYIARSPVSLQKLKYVKEMRKVIYNTKYNKYFGENIKVFDVLDFIADLTQHIPEKGSHLIRYYGVYASRTKGKRKSLGKKEYFDKAEIDESKKAKRRAWARLIQKVFEADPLICPKCKSEMNVVSVIFDRQEIAKILNHLHRKNRAPPGYEKLLTDVD